MEVEFITSDSAIRRDTGGLKFLPDEVGEARWGMDRFLYGAEETY
jgi:hypothetical protein